MLLILGGAIVERVSCPRRHCVRRQALAPRASLGVLTAAALLPDLVWPVLLLTGVEHVEIDPGNTAFMPLAFVHYPISHSLLTTASTPCLATGVASDRRSRHVEPLAPVRTPPPARPAALPRLDSIRRTGL
jgi:hypothetical protein